MENEPNVEPEGCRRVPINLNAGGRFQVGASARPVSCQGCRGAQASERLTLVSQLPLAKGTPGCRGAGVGARLPSASVPPQESPLLAVLLLWNGGPCRQRLDLVPATPKLSAQP